MKIELSFLILIGLTVVACSQKLSIEDEIDQCFSQNNISSKTSDLSSGTSKLVESFVYRYPETRPLSVVSIMEMERGTCSCMENKGEFSLYSRMSQHDKTVQINADEQNVVIKYDTDIPDIELDIRPENLEFHFYSNDNWNFKYGTMSIRDYHVTERDTIGSRMLLVFKCQEGFDYSKLKNFDVKENFWDFAFWEINKPRRTILNEGLLESR